MATKINIKRLIPSMAEELVGEYLQSSHRESHDTDAGVGKPIAKCTKKDKQRIEELLADFKPGGSFNPALVEKNGEFYFIGCSIIDHLTCIPGTSI
jgi:hypothetical protein